MVPTNILSLNTVTAPGLRLKNAVILIDCISQLILELSLDNTGTRPDGVCVDGSLPFSLAAMMDYMNKLKVD